MYEHKYLRLMTLYRTWQPLIKNKTQNANSTIENESFKNKQQTKNPSLLLQQHPGNNHHFCLNYYEMAKKPSAIPAAAASGRDWRSRQPWTIQGPFKFLSSMKEALLFRSDSQKPTLRSSKLCLVPAWTGGGEKLASQHWTPGTAQRAGARHAL